MQNAREIADMKLAEALNIAVLTDCGRVRPNNEDAVFADQALGLAILADGMGGNNGGEVASAMAISLLSNSLAAILHACFQAEDAATHSLEELKTRLQAEIDAVNLAIFNVSLSEARFAGMGTTLVLACFYDNRMTVAHIGDSRLYRLRQGRLMQLTRDHSLLQEYLDNGMMRAGDTRFAGYKGLLTRALGVGPWADVDIADHDLLPGDVVLLCSDGLSEMVPEEVIADILQAGREAPQLAAEALVRTANERGGMDNVSVIVVKVRSDFALPAGWWKKLWVHLK